MNLFLINVLLAVGFMIALESFTLSSLIMGLIVGYGAMWLTRPLYGGDGGDRYFHRVPTIIRLVVFFLKALFVSNLQVLWDVVTPAHISRPGIISLPLDARTDLEIMLVANLISLTPGTLSIDVSEDRRTLYVHVMFLNDIEETRRELKEGLEQRVLEVLR
jgi:multicomponent Na+:H+ antiporter subunit E